MYTEDHGTDPVYLRKNRTDSVTGVSNSKSGTKEYYSDVSNEERSNITSRGLDASGMDGIAVPINIDLGNLGFQIQFATARATVNTVDGSIKGIHMSRLYLNLTEVLETEPFCIPTVNRVLDRFKKSHEDISSEAQLELSFNWPIKREALKSGKAGWKLYPVKLRSSIGKNGEHCHRLELSIKYASFCPCSASLARQLLQKNFETDFSGDSTVDVSKVIEWLGKKESINAIPHGQRSTATVSFDLFGDDKLDLTRYVDLLEDAVKTPVQTAVKRPDEQEFARVCASNLMFVEDAAKIFYKALKDANLKGISISVAHHESLHAHDAVASIND